MPTDPQVTIGLPVRNGVPDLRVALDSLLSQTYENFVLVISDNDSTDDTGDVCREYAERDPRVRYIRQKDNLGNPGNFHFTLQQAQTPYFMWAAHDDIWSPTFIERTIAQLEANPGAVCSCPQISLETYDGEVVLSNGTYAITGDMLTRLKRYFYAPGEVSRYYGLYRTEVLQKSYPRDVMVFGFDWVIAALTLIYGEHLEVNEALLYRKGQAPGHYFRTLLRFENDFLDRIIPFRRFTLKLREKLPPEAWRACRWYILRLNIVQILSLAKYKLPFLGPIVKAISNTERAVMKRPPALKTT